MRIRARFSFGVANRRRPDPDPATLLTHPRPPLHHWPFPSGPAWAQPGRCRDGSSPSVRSNTVRKSMFGIIDRAPFGNQSDHLGAQPGRPWDGLGPGVRSNRLANNISDLTDRAFFKNETLLFGAQPGPPWDGLGPGVRSNHREKKMLTLLMGLLQKRRFSI